MLEESGNYDSTSRPSDGAVTVNVSLLINTLEIDDVRQVLKISGVLHQEWHDLKFLFLSAAGKRGSTVGLEGQRSEAIKSHLWLPDITLAQGFQSKTMRDFLKIWSNGRLIWTQQVFYEFPCKFDYSSYPLGKQVCSLNLMSLGYDHTEVDPRWTVEEPVSYGSAVVSLRYTIVGVKTSSKIVMTQGAKRQLRATFVLKNVSGWPVKHTVLPFIVAVAIAYLTFFMDVKGLTARMVLCCTALIIASIFNESTYDKTPQAPYTMAIEVFTGVCLTLIWGSIVESIVVDVLSRWRSPTSSSSSHNTFPEEHAEMLTPSTSARGLMAALWVDRCFRVVYLIIFIVFNVVYWILYH